MPINIVKSFAKQSGKTEAEVEKLWDEAKMIAQESGHKEEYDYIVGILKKMLKLEEKDISSFKSFIAETADSDYNGMSVYGDTLRVELKKAEYTDLMRIEFSGDKTLTKIKSAETLKSEYSEKNWSAIEKIWAKIADKRSKELDKAVKKFERDLEGILKNIEKDLSEY